MAVTMKIAGLRETLEALGQYSKATNKGAMQKVAVTALDEEFVPVARENAPDDPATGSPDLKTSIFAGKRLTPRQARLNRKRDDKSFAEGFAGTSDPAGIQTEFGNVHQAPQGWMRKTWAATVGAIQSNVTRNVKGILDKAATRAAARALKKAGK